MHLFIATTMPRNKTSIYTAISDGLQCMAPAVPFKVGRNWTVDDLPISRRHRLIVANSNSEDIIYSISNHRSASVLLQQHIEVKIALFCHKTA